LQSFDENIQQALEKMNGIKVNTQADVMSEVNLLVAEQVANIDSGNIQSVLQGIDEKLATKIESILEENINQILSGFSASMSNMQAELQSLSNFSVQNEYQTIRVRYSDRSLWNRITFGAFGRSHSYMSEEVMVGDNREAAILNYKNNRVKAYSELVLENYQQVETSFFTPLRELHHGLTNDVTQLKMQVNALKKHLQEAS